MHHAHLVEHIAADNPSAVQAIAGMQSSGMSWEQAMATINNLIGSQALTMSAVDIFYASGLIFVVLTGMVWFARPGKPAASSAEAGAVH